MSSSNWPNPDSDSDRESADEQPQIPGDDVEFEVRDRGGYVHFVGETVDEWIKAENPVDMPDRTGSN